MTSIMHESYDVVIPISTVFIADSASEKSAQRWKKVAAVLLCSTLVIVALRNGNGNGSGSGSGNGNGNGNSSDEGRRLLSLDPLSLSGLNESCDLRFGDEDCQPGLACTEVEGRRTDAASLSSSSSSKPRSTSERIGICNEPTKEDSIERSLESGSTKKKKKLGLRLRNKDRNSDNVNSLADGEISIMPNRESSLQPQSEQLQQQGFALPKFLDELNACDVRYGNEACKDDLVCVVTSKSSYSQIGVCSRLLGASATFAGKQVVEVPKRQELGEDCKHSYGNKACQTGLKCAHSVSSQYEDIGVCIEKAGNDKSGGKIVDTMKVNSESSAAGEIPSLQSEGQLCDIAHGYDACELGYSCFTKTDASKYRCFDDDWISTVVVSQWKEEGLICDFGRTPPNAKVCPPDFECSPTGVVAINPGICLRKSDQDTTALSTNSGLFIPKFQQEGDSCDIIHRDRACIAGLFCDGGTAAEAGTCIKLNTNSGSLEPSGAEKTVVSVPEFQDEGQACDNAFGSSACMVGLKCTASGDASTSYGICVVEVTVTVPQISELQEEGHACDTIFGDSACLAGLVCTSSGDASTTYGICVAAAAPATVEVTPPQEPPQEQETFQQVEVPPVISQTPPTPPAAVESPPEMQMEGQACNVQFGMNACLTGFSCNVADGSTSVSLGVCIKPVAPPIPGDSSGTPVTNAGNAPQNTGSALQPNQSEGQACDTSYGATACASGLSCITDADDVTTVGYGFCTAVPTMQGEGRVCSLSHGVEACVSGFKCIVEGDAGFGTCTIDSSAADLADADWWVYWDTSNCVRNCPEGAAPNCMGMRPIWDDKSYATAEECCQAHYSWKRFEDCVPEYPIL